MALQGNLHNVLLQQLVLRQTSNAGAGLSRCAACHLLGPEWYALVPLT